MKHPRAFPKPRVFTLSISALEMKIPAMTMEPEKIENYNKSVPFLALKTNMLFDIALIQT